MADYTLKTRIQLRNDTEANWLLVADTLVPLAGEICITNDGDHKGQFKVGDGTSTWGTLPYSGADGSSITVDASQVTFDQDLVFTEPFGKYEPTGGQVTIPADGQSLLEVLLDAFAQDSNPAITQPSASIASSDFKAYEVGTNVTPKFTVNFNAGNYQYGPSPTGVTATSYTVTDNAAPQNTVNTSTGSFPELQVGDDTSYSINAVVAHSAGSVPLTALKQEYAAGQIQAGSKSASKGTITGYRNGFYGTFTDLTELTSANIRTLTPTNKAVTAGTVLNISIPVGAKRVVFAYPASIRAVSSVQDVNGMSAEIKPTFTELSVSVLGANDYAGIDYRVYYLDYANPNDAQNTYKVTI